MSHILPTGIIGKRKTLIKMLIVMLCTTAFHFLYIANAHAQGSFDVEGTITDGETGETLPGVNISVMGTSTGTVSQSDGTYQLTAPSQNDTLRFSFVGFDTKIVPINGRSVINVELASTTYMGDELVVVGYNTQARKDLTGSVSVVDMDQFAERTTGQITKELQGLSSGVTVVSSGQPGESPNIRIRGINTFGNNQPLYVVDGVPTQTIDDLNSKDVASMQVLKDAAAASIYGSRAANGVIIITTKKGKGDIKFDYNGSYGYTTPKSGNVWNTLSPMEMAQLKWRAVENSGNNPRPDPQYGNGQTPVLPDYILPAGLTEDQVNLDSYYVIPEYNDPAMVNNFNQIVRANKNGTNWFDEIFDPAGTMTHDLRISGGGEIGNYLFSLNYLKEDGTLMQTYRDRYTLRANTNFNVSENIRIGENLSYSVSENPQVNALTEGSAIGMSFREQPIIPVYDVRGNFAGTAAPTLGNADNPAAYRYRSRNNEATNTRLFGNIFAEIDLLENLLFKTSFGGEIYSGSNRSFAYPEYENAENSTTNSFSANSYNGHNYTWSNTLNYQEVFAEKHDFELTLGTEAYKNKGNNLGGTTQSYFSFNPDYTNLSTGSGTQTNYSSYYEDALLSFFGRVDYSYDNKYILSATIRRDGSSRFLNNQWGWFPAGSIGWRISDESFMENVNWLSDLKFRFGYGIMGNQLNVDPNNPYSLFAGDQNGSYYPVDGSNSNITQGFSQVRIGNPNAKWEKNITSNLGFDATLFGDRIEISADYYWKDVRDLLYNPQLVGTAGTATAPYVNVANMRNQGVDASVNTFGEIGSDMQYNLGVNFTSYRNEIQKIAEGTDYFDQEARRFTGSNIVRNQVGHPVSSFYGYQIIGFWDTQQEIDDANAGAAGGSYQESAAVGRFRYADTNGDGQITPADRTFLGNPNPDFTYGINFGLNYKEWDLSMFLYGSQGNDVWNQVKYWTDFYGSFNGAKSKTALYDSWTPNNKDASMAIQEESGNFSTSSVPNSYYVENASYLRLKNVQLGYSFSPDMLQRLGLRKLRIYVQGNNLLTFTGYSGVDPEIGFSPNANGGTSTSFGIDEGAYPTQRQYLVGINISY